MVLCRTLSEVAENPTVISPLQRRDEATRLVSPEGIGRALDLKEMMEATARSLAYAAVQGGAKTLSRQDVAGLEEVLRVRNLPMPGLPGAVEHLADIFEF